MYLSEARRRRIRRASNHVAPKNGREAGREAGRAEGTTDQDAAEELLLFAWNTGELYPERVSIERTMRTMQLNKTYNPETAWQLWMPWVEKSAKLYKKEIRSNIRFSQRALQIAARNLASTQADVLARGELDDFLWKGRGGGGVNENPVEGGKRQAIHKTIASLDSGALAHLTEEGEWPDGYAASGRDRKLAAIELHKRGFRRDRKGTWAGEDPIEARDYESADKALARAHEFLGAEWYIRERDKITLYAEIHGQWWEAKLTKSRGLYHWPSDWERKVKSLPRGAQPIARMDPHRGTPGGISREHTCEHCGAKEASRNLEVLDDWRWREGSIFGRRQSDCQYVQTSRISKVNGRSYGPRNRKLKEGDVVQTESGTEYRLGVFTMDWQDRGRVAQENPIDEDGIPWVKVERDPQAHAEAIEVQKQFGPIKNSRSVYDLLSSWAQRQNQEHLLVVLLDIHSELIGVALIHKGERDRVSVDPADVLKPAIDRGAKGITMVHNHPSGQAAHSKADADLTKSIREACEVQNIAFVDHVVLGTGEYYSFADKKLTKVKKK